MSDLYVTISKKVVGEPLRLETSKARAVSMGLSERALVRVGVEHARGSAGPARCERGANTESHARAARAAPSCSFYKPATFDLQAKLAKRTTKERAYSTALCALVAEASALLFQNGSLNALATCNERRPRAPEGAPRAVLSPEQTNRDVLEVPPREKCEPAVEVGPPAARWDVLAEMLQEDVRLVGKTYPLGGGGPIASMDTSDALLVCRARGGLYEVCDGVSKPISLGALVATRAARVGETVACALLDGRVAARGAVSSYVHRRGALVALASHGDSLFSLSAEGALTKWNPSDLSAPNVQVQLRGAAPGKGSSQAAVTSNQTTVDVETKAGDDVGQGGENTDATSNGASIDATPLQGSCMGLVWNPQTKATEVLAGTVHGMVVALDLDLKVLRQVQYTNRIRGIHSTGLKGVFIVHSDVDVFLSHAERPFLALRDLRAPPAARAPAPDALRAAAPFRDAVVTAEPVRGHPGVLCVVLASGTVVLHDVLADRALARKAAGAPAACARVDGTTALLGDAHGVVHHIALNPDALPRHTPSQFYAFVRHQIKLNELQRIGR